MTEPASPAPEKRVVIADAGPLIHLDELACLGLLADFSEIRVPDAVWREVEHHRPLALQCTEIQLLRCSTSISETIEALSSLYALHAGEREALSLCQQTPDALLLSDDTAARLAAKTLSLQAHGTIGLLLRAIRRQQLSKPQVLELLRQIPERSSLHIRPGLLADIVQQVEAE